MNQYSLLIQRKLNTIDICGISNKFYFGQPRNEILIYVAGIISPKITGEFFF